MQSERNIYIYPGGYYKMPKTVFEELDNLNIHIPYEDRYYPFFITYDFESILVDVKNKTKGNKTEIKQEHKACSVSIASNIKLPDCQHNNLLSVSDLCCKYKKPKCFIDSNLDSLLEQFVNHLRFIQEKASELITVKYRRAFEKLMAAENKLLAHMKDLENELVEVDKGHHYASHEATEGTHDQSIDPKMEKLLQKPNTFSTFLNRLCVEDKWEILYNSFSDEGDNSSDSGKSNSISGTATENEYDDYNLQECKEQLRTLENIKNKLQEYCTQIPVLSFRGSTYDINLVKKKLPFH